MVGCEACRHTGYVVQGYGKFRHMFRCPSCNKRPSAEELAMQQRLNSFGAKFPSRDGMYK